MCRGWMGGVGWEGMIRCVCARRGGHGPNEVCQSVRGALLRDILSASRVQYGIHGPDALSVCGATKRDGLRRRAALLSTAPKIIPCAATCAYGLRVFSTKAGSVRGCGGGVAGVDLCAVRWAGGVEGEVGGGGGGWGGGCGGEAGVREAVVVDGGDGGDGGEWGEWGEVVGCLERWGWGGRFLSRARRGGRRVGGG